MNPLNNKKRRIFKVKGKCSVCGNGLLMDRSEKSKSDEIVYYFKPCFVCVLMNDFIRHAIKHGLDRTLNSKAYPFDRIEGNTFVDEDTEKQWKIWKKERQENVDV